MPWVFLQSGQLIWRSGTRRFHLRVPDLQMRCRRSTDHDYTTGYQDNSPSNGDGATYPHYILALSVALYFQVIILILGDPWVCPSYGCPTFRCRMTYETSASHLVTLGWPPRAFPTLGLSKLTLVVLNSFKEMWTFICVFIISQHWDD